MGASTHGVRLWFPRVETAAYRVVARVAARALAGLRFVRSVYARRSVASGEVVFGRSDIDLHVIIDPFEDPIEEGRALAVLARRLQRLRAVLPLLGDCDVSTPAELELWYRDRPGNWHRDRGWLRLWGETHERPKRSIDARIAPASIVRWFLIASQRLPELVRRNAAHHCASVAADLLHAHYLIREGLPGRRLRADILERWRREDESDPRRAHLSAGYANAFRKRAYGVAVLAQELALELADALAADLDSLPRGARVPRELAVRLPFAFEERRLLFPDPHSLSEMHEALRELRHDPRVVLASLGTLALRLRYWAPWEWETYGTNDFLRLREPSVEDYLTCVRLSLHKEFPRRAGLALGTAVETELRLVQCKLHLEEGIRGAPREQLREAYGGIYGHPPEAPPASSDEYFARHYPASAGLIDELRAHPRLR